MQTYQVRIYFEDTDCGGIVYHTNYIKYCERARSEMFFARGNQPYAGNCGFVVSSLEAKFHASARLGDVLEVRSRILHTRQSSLRMEQKIYRIQKICGNSEGYTTTELTPQEQELIFSMEVTLAFVDTAHQKITKIPSAFLTLLQGV
ncbi:MAG TPA: acyl-CoA thioesterase [Candidatus Helicobacter avicola]|nr:acyl-CoA thioesterase [Candidatus Helicobacter avicola]